MLTVIIIYNYISLSLSICCDAVSNKKLTFGQLQRLRSVLDGVQTARSTASRKSIHTHDVPEVTHCVTTECRTIRRNAPSVTYALVCDLQIAWRS